MYNRKWTDAIWVTGWHKQTSCPPPVIMNGRNISLSSHATFKGIMYLFEILTNSRPGYNCKNPEWKIVIFYDKTKLLSNIEWAKNKLHLYWNNLQFFFQANDLVKSLMASTPSYVRTIKPNETKLPGKRSLKNYVDKKRWVGCPKMLTFCQHF